MRIGQERLMFQLQFLEVKNFMFLILFTFFFLIRKHTF